VGGSEGTYGGHTSPPYPIRLLATHPRSMHDAHLCLKGASGTKTNNRSRARPGTPGALPHQSRTAHHPCGRCVMFATAPHSVDARTPSLAAHTVASNAFGTGSERCQGGGVCDIVELYTSSPGVPTVTSKSTVPDSTHTWGGHWGRGINLVSAGGRARWRFSPI
jgi:hypothetical protein